MPMLLGQNQSEPMDVLVWSLVLVGLVLVAFVAVVVMKRRLREPDEPVGTGFTLSDLRQMHREGRLSDEEYEKAKATITQAVRAAAEREEKAEP